MEDFSCIGVTHDGDLLIMTPSAIGFDIIVNEYGKCGAMTIDESAAEKTLRMARQGAG